MKKITFLLLAVLLISPFYSANAQTVTKFSFDDDLEGWTGYGSLQREQVDLVTLEQVLELSVNSSLYGNLPQYVDNVASPAVSDLVTNPHYAHVVLRGSALLSTIVVKYGGQPAGSVNFATTLDGAFQEVVIPLDDDFAGGPAELRFEFRTDDKDNTFFTAGQDVFQIDYIEINGDVNAGNLDPADNPTAVAPVVSKFSFDTDSEVFGTFSAVTESNIVTSSGDQVVNLENTKVDNGVPESVNEIQFNTGALPVPSLPASNHYFHILYRSDADLGRIRVELNSAFGSTVINPVGNSITGAFQEGVIDISNIYIEDAPGSGVFGASAIFKIKFDQGDFAPGESVQVDYIEINNNPALGALDPADNPTSGVASVESSNGVVFTAADVVSVSYYTILGTKVNTFNTVEKSNIQNLSTGIYIESITLIDGRVLNKQIFKR